MKTPFLLEDDNAERKEPTKALALPYLKPNPLEASIPELEDALFAALQELPHLEKGEHSRALSADPLPFGVNV